MEIAETTKVQLVKLTGEDLSGDVKIVNGSIDKCIVATTVKGEVHQMDLTEQQVRDLSKELFDLVGWLDKEQTERKGVLEDESYL